MYKIIILLILSICMVNEIESLECDSGVISYWSGKQLVGECGSNVGVLKTVNINNNSNSAKIVTHNGKSSFRVYGGDDSTKGSGFRVTLQPEILGSSYSVAFRVAVDDNNSGNVSYFMRGTNETNDYLVVGTNEQKIQLWGGSEEFTNNARFPSTTNKYEYIIINIDEGNIVSLYVNSKEVTVDSIDFTNDIGNGQISFGLFATGTSSAIGGMSPHAYFRDITIYNAAITSNVIADFANSPPVVYNCYGKTSDNILACNDGVCVADNTCDCSQTDRAGAECSTLRDADDFNKEVFNPYTNITDPKVTDGGSIGGLIVGIIFFVLIGIAVGVGFCWSVAES